MSDPHAENKPLYAKDWLYADERTYWRAVYDYGVVFSDSHPCSCDSLDHGKPLRIEPRPPAEWFDLMRSKRVPSDEPNSEPTDDGVLSGAALHRAIADAMDAGESCYEFEHNEDSIWQRPVSWPDLVGAAHGGAQVRRKPRTLSLTAQDGTVYEWPEPLKWPLEYGARFYLSFDDDFGSEALEFSVDETREHREKRWFIQGRCFATREARDAHERALIAVSGGQS